MSKKSNIENVNPEANVFSLAECKEKLRPLCYSKGKSTRTFQQFFRLFYFIRLLKYTTNKQLQSINFSGSGKVATKPILNKLCDLGLISTNGLTNDVIVPNEITDLIVMGVKYNDTRYHKLFAPLPRGVETSNEVKNSEIFVQAVNLHLYYGLLFPSFEYVIPDGLLILKKDNKYKLHFLEIETEQSNWSQRFERMKDNYHRLSKDKVVYDYWKNTASQLKLPVPEIQNFCFSVIVISDIERDLGNGFIFRRSLNE